MHGINRGEVNENVLSGNVARAVVDQVTVVTLRDERRPVKRSSVRLTSSRGTAYERRRWTEACERVVVERPGPKLHTLTNAAVTQSAFVIRLTRARGRRLGVSDDREVAHRTSFTKRERGLSSNSVASCTRRSRIFKP